MLFLALLLPHLCWAEQWVLKSQDHKDNAKSPLDAAFADFVNETLQYYHIPGLSISVVRGQETYAEGYGLASLSPDIPAKPETLYYGGSTTKAFTAAAASLLVDNGTLTWKTRLSDVIHDDFILNHTYATSHVTLEDALSHRTGLPRHDFVFGNPNLTSIKDIVRGLRHLPLTAEPRTRFQYNNLVYVTVGYVIEALTSNWLGDILHEHIWQPLGMTNTYFSREDALASASPFAHGYAWNNKTKTYTEFPWSATNLDTGAGAVISNVLDYARWLRSLLHRTEPLSAASHAALMTPRTILEPETMGLNEHILTGDAVYSLGWFRHTYRGQLFVFHGGSVRGFGAHAVFLPGLDLAIAVMANTQGTSNFAAQRLIYRIVDDLLGVPVGERYDWLEGYANQTATSAKLLARAKTDLFPTLPSPPLPHSLHLVDYIGYYTHPIYPSFNLTTHDRKLELKIDGDLLKGKVELEHVSGEHWLGTLWDGYTGEIMGKMRAEFRVDVAGKVTAFGLELEHEVVAAFGEKTWFTRE